MSGIVGIFRRDGGVVEQRQIRAMLEAIAHRGPDKSDLWCEGAIGLGNCLLWTTPEAVREELPAQRSGEPLVAVADARIDNRDELREALGIPERGVTDSALILAAYSKWGEECPQHLVGDFSFAIWDQAQQKLFCARDSYGLRSFYYYSTPEVFVFGSEIKALKSLPEVPIALNETRVGDYLINLYEDRSGTFYKDIFRLPAATAITVTRSRLNRRLYWKLDPTREIRLKDNGEYAQAFKELFDEAVRCRLRSSHPVGSALSGGLDSSAIACTARNMSQSTLHTFSIIFPSVSEDDLKVIDERRYINRVLETGRFQPHFIRGDELSPIGDAARIHHHLDEANFAPNLYLHWAMYASARENGVRVFLDGLDGDTTVSHGFEYLPELALRLRWRTLHSEAKLIAENLFGGSSNPRRILWNYCIKDIAPLWMFQAWRLMRGRFGEVRENSTLLRPDVTARLDLRGRARRLTPPRQTSRARRSHHSGLTAALHAHALEMADKTSAAFGVEARYPFFDRRLIEFCLALPANQKLGQGWNRMVFRRAMEDVLPREIQWRGTKGNLSSNFHRRLLDFEGATLERIGTSSAADYLDRESLRRALEEYRASPLGSGGKNSIQLFTAANLALWMEQTKIGRAKHA